LDGGDAVSAVQPFTQALCLGPSSQAFDVVGRTSGQLLLGRQVHCGDEPEVIAAWDGHVCDIGGDGVANQSVVDADPWRRPHSGRERTRQTLAETHVDISEAIVDDRSIWRVVHGGVEVADHDGRTINGVQFVSDGR
jgi:hypothetical protein